jgi:DNA excision repair protein ERCC-2
MTDRISPKEFFPYPKARKGQDEMMGEIDAAVREGKQICAEAPNGFGKTCVSLSGVLPWVIENQGKVLYCARTHRQLDRVIEELVAITEGEGQTVSGVSFRGRRHMCLNPFVLENAGVVASISEVCSQLKSSRKCPFYERLRRMVSAEDLIESLPKKVLTAPEIVEIATKRNICPYELAKQLAKIVDVVALSYLYIFDSWVREAFFPELETPLSKIILIEDEAHNVPTTALDSASDSLPIGTIRLAVREATTYNDSISKEFCKALAKSILNQSTTLKENSELGINPQSIYDTAVRECGLKEGLHPLIHMREVGTKIHKGLLRAGKFPRSYINRVAEFMTRWLDHKDREDYTFVIASNREKSDNRRVSLDLVALDPTVVTKPVLSQVHSSVAISGTISPLNAYAEMLGFENEATLATVQNPFAMENRLGIVVEGLDTSYRSRSDKLYQRMVDHCVTVAHATPGNTGIFTTSYFLAKSLIKAGLERRLGKELFMEKQGMKGQQNDKMIEEFKSRGAGRGAVLLGVQGGRNSEGGDFPGATMNSVVVVGVPYARPTPRIESLIQYFDSRFNGRGRDYAYVLPAMTRATQAAGRPVRRLDDKGAIILLDQRFATPYLKRFMPQWLAEVTRTIPDNPDMVAQQLEAFFSY